MQTSKQIDSERSLNIFFQPGYKIPKSGFKAFYIDLEYADPNGGKYTRALRQCMLADDDEILLVKNRAYWFFRNYHHSFLLLAFTLHLRKLIPAEISSSVSDITV